MALQSYVNSVGGQKSWSGVGSLMVLPNSPIGQTYPDFGGCTYNWAGYWGTRWTVDVCSGFYLVLGQQMALDAERSSWQDNQWEYTAKLIAGA